MTEIQKRVKQEKQYCFSQLNPRPLRTKYREFQPSMIVPDRNMTISVIMSKYAGGQHRGLEPQYTPPEMMDYVQGIDARKLSICELHQRIDENKNQIRRIQQDLQNQEILKQHEQAKIAQQAYREKIASEIKKELQETPKPQ